MLVVIHEYDAVRVFGNGLQNLVIGAGRSGHIEPQIARVHVGIELFDEGDVGWVSVIRQAFKVQRKTAVGRKRSEKAQDLLAQGRAVPCVGQEATHAGVPPLSVGVEIVQMGKYFRVFPGILDDMLDPAQVIRIVYRGAVDHGILAMALVVNSQQYRL